MISSVFREDINQITVSPEIPWGDFRDSTILVTGATGLVGNALVHALSAANAQYSLDMRIIAHGRNAEKGALLAEEVCGVEVVCGDIRNTLTSIEIISDRIDYIFHCAAVTKSSDMIGNPVDVITTAIDGTQNVLKLARKKQSRSVVFLSSMEVYGQLSHEEVTERDLGYLDLSNPRSSYPESKRFCECLCAGYCKQYGIPVKIARLAQTFGAGTPPDDTRVFAQFARSAIVGEEIVLHTEGKSRGNYCYISDSIRALLLLLIKGENGEVYNIANSDASTTIREMAELVAQEFKTSAVVDVPYDIAERGYAPYNSFRLNTDKMISLGWVPKYDLTDMYTRMVHDWREGELVHAKSPAKENTWAVENN